MPENTGAVIGRASVALDAFANRPSKKRRLPARPAATPAKPAWQTLQRDGTTRREDARLVSAKAVARKMALGFKY